MAETPEERLAAAGHALPEATSPVATYVTWRQTGNVLYLSGHGECGDEFTTGKGARAAVGMASLPSDIAVEIQAIVELHPED